MHYEDLIRLELRLWEKELLKPLSFVEKSSKAVSRKINSYIPEKVHQLLTATVKGIVHTSLLGAEYTPKSEVAHHGTLQERDKKARELLDRYKKIAAAEGAGTGAGGILLGAVDFPALIAIKMKFLFELAHVYGFDTNVRTERLYILHLFQLAFSGPEHKRKVYDTIRNPEKESEIDWETFQQEYRDSIDFRKMLQLVPGIGAVVGAWANYGLLEELGRTAMNGYRIRLLEK